MSIVNFFIVLQVILLLFMTFHDWINLPPLLNIKDLEKSVSIKTRLISSVIFFFMIFIPLVLTYLYKEGFSFSVLITIVNFYGGLTLGTIFSWWVPYIVGSSDEHKRNFAIYNNTHHFLPARGNNVVPNTFHVILHLQIWLCFAISIYLLVAHSIFLQGS